MRRCITAAVGIVLLFAASIAASDVSEPNAMLSSTHEAVTATPTPSTTPSTPEVQTLAGSKADYPGRLRVYVVEPTSRWDAADGRPYHEAFFSWAIDQDINIPDGEILTLSSTWNSYDEGFYSILETNIAAVAALFDDAYTTENAYPYPGYNYPFRAHAVDATARAAAGEIGQNEVTGTYTHTVFVEEATATWCGYCPDVRDWLGALHRNAGYNFEFVALVDDSCDFAAYRLSSNTINGLNVGAFPTCYVDGGTELVVGAAGQSAIASALNAAGSRAVPDLDMLIKTEYIATNTIQVTVAIGNGVPANTAPGTPSIVSGVTEAVEGTEYDFEALSIDPEANTMEYRFDFSDGTITDWIGPFADGENGLASHAWSTTGTTYVRVLARDFWGIETTWSVPYAVEVIPSTCCRGDSRGNVDGSLDFQVTMSDLTVLIDHLFISLSPLDCVDEGNLDGDILGEVTMSDLTVLIDHLFISLNPLPPCQ